MSTVEAPLHGARNFRDFGGCPTADGRHVRRARLYRSEVLSRLSEADVERLRTLQISAVCDLRHGQERQRHLNRWPADRIPPLIGEPPREGFEAAQGADLQRRLLEPTFDTEEVRELLMAGYRRMPAVLAPSLHAVFTHLLESAAAPLLIHCTSGKDRSGFVSALVLTALGVSREVVTVDYLLSHDRHPVEHMRRTLLSALGDRLPPGRLDVLLDLAGVHADYLDAAFQQIDADFGGVERYLHEAAGLDASRCAQLQALLLDDEEP